MNLKQVTNTELLNNTYKLVREESELLLKVLYHLREIQNRRLFSDLGYQSLYEFCMHKLGYTEDQVSRRMAAMQLLKELPEIESKISSGALSLTNLSIAKKFFGREKKEGKTLSKESKLELLTQFENISSRQAERVVAAISPHYVQSRFSVRAINADESEVRIVVRNSALDKIKTAKGLAAHSLPLADEGEIIELALGSYIESNTPVARRGAARKEGVMGQTNSPVAAENLAPKSEGKTAEAEIRRQVWQRDRGCCTQCKSTYALEIDHIIPKAKGGSDELYNRRLLCRNCNQRAAIVEFGQSKMSRYLKSPAAAYAVASSG